MLAPNSDTSFNENLNAVEGINFEGQVKRVLPVLCWLIQDSQIDFLVYHFEDN